MNKERYVSYEIAKLLKEKGFDWECSTYLYTTNVYNYGAEPCRFQINDSKNSELASDKMTAPTQQMACDWLREEHNIHIMPTIGCDVDRTPRIFYGVVIALFNDDGDIDYRTTDGNEYDEPEDAVEAALEYVLKNLI